MRCNNPKCGKEIENTAKVCPYCGECQIMVRGKDGKFYRAENAKSQPVQSSEEIYEEVQDAERVDPTDSKKKRRVPKVAIVFLIAMCVLITVKMQTGKDADGSIPVAETQAVREDSQRNLDEKNIMNNMGQSEEHLETTEEVETEAKDKTDMKGVEEPVAAAETKPVNEPVTVVIGELSDEYIFPDIDKVLFHEEDLLKCTKEQLYYGRNELYARHGRAFRNKELQRHFEGKSWYQEIYSPDDFDNKGDTLFNEYEIYNRNLIVSVEDKLGYK